MSARIPAGDTPESESAREAIGWLRDSVLSGEDWPAALLGAVSRWTDPESAVNGRRYGYFIGGEAFDWLVLAERLCVEIAGLVPEDEVEDLLLFGRLPQRFDKTRFRELLGGEKYRGHLNYFYGVTVEEALQVAVETEIVKRRISNGYLSASEVSTVSTEAFPMIYGMPEKDLLDRFRGETGAAFRRRMSLEDVKEFTYWLFKLRLKVSDKARIASDTRKGLEQLARMRAASRSRPPAAIEAVVV